MKRILIASDSFKGTLSSSEVCNLIEKHCEGFSTLKLPLADGGDGSIDVIADNGNYEKESCIVLDPLGRPIKSFYLIDRSNSRAYIELAKSSGLTLLEPSERDPLKTNTYGVGMTIRSAICAGCTDIVIFAGGSATNDAGTGALAALGVKFYAGEKWIEFPTGQDLSTIDRIDTSSLITNRDYVKFTVAGDVNNLFYGTTGAAHIYAPQKGANTEAVEKLDKGLNSFSNYIFENQSIDLQQMAGTGAAGGFSGGVHAFLGADIISGAEYIFDLLNIDEKLDNVDIVITGEGKIDSQTLNNKLVKNVLERAYKFEKPVYGICGSLDLTKSELEKLNFKHVVSLAEDASEINNCMANPYYYFNTAAIKLVETINAHFENEA